mmetsp:Transcript_34708/g.72226  ORF Transcript_34708/g.72226 Transcript_34708/m.72226 type:complete len:85 (+) Transcript_34708:67-321(+)
MLAYIMIDLTMEWFAQARPNKNARANRMVECCSRALVVNSGRQMFTVRVMSWNGGRRLTLPSGQVRGTIMIVVFLRFLVVVRRR